MAEVKTRSLSKVFHSRDKEVQAVHHLDVDIRDGEFIAFVGPSGSGKTTFLRLVAGLEAATSGSIYIGERDVTTFHARARGIAMVFQDYALYPHMSVRENLSFGLQNLRYPKQEIDKRVREAAALLQIDMLLDRRPRELSGGQRQRVAVGRAIVRNPEVYLFDEPLSNLDAKLRGQMRVELASLHQRLQTTTIYVTHDQVEAMTLGERIALMNGGVLQQIGSARELYEQPSNLFVAGFIGSPAMNMLRGELIADGAGRLCLLSGDRRLPIPADLEACYRPRVGSRVILGLRPEHISVPRGAGREDGVLLSVMPKVIENLGEYVLAYFEFGGTLVAAKLVPEADARVGRPIELSFNLNKMHLFNPDTERAIPRQ